MKSLVLLFLFWTFASFADMHVVLLAGGGGTRLWPLSTNEWPKQFITFEGGESLLQKTVRRVMNIDRIGQIVIATSQKYESIVRSQLELFATQTNIHVLVEPHRKNTAPAIAFACKYLLQYCKEDDGVLIAPCDHSIYPEEEFAAAVANIFPSLEKGKIITFGILPTKPETGYGYLELGSPYDAHTFAVKKFIEKPKLEVAEKLIQSDRVFWNAGIFAFSLRTFWEELSAHAPQIAKLSAGSFEDLKKSFSQMPDVSIDYAIMEKSQKIVACPLSIYWSDIGSWDSLYEISSKDSDGNVLQGNVCQLNGKNNLIFSKKRLIAAIDIEDLLVIETEDAILVAKRGESQKVKMLLQKLNGQ